MNAQAARKIAESADLDALHESHVRYAYDRAMEIITMEAERGKTETRTSIGYPWDIPMRAQAEAIDRLRREGYKVSDHDGGTVFVRW